MCTKIYNSYDDYALENFYRISFNELLNNETKNELTKIVNGEYNLETCEIDSLFHHLKDNSNIKISYCYKIVGNIYSEQAKYEKAEQAYLLSHKYGSPNALVNLALMYIDDQHDIKKGYEILMPLIEQNHPVACRIYSSYLYDESKYEQAEKYALIAIENGDIIAMQILGRIYLATRQFDKIDKYKNMINDAIENESHYINHLYNGKKFNCHLRALAYLYRETKQYDKFMEALNLILNSSPDDITHIIVLCEKIKFFAKNNDNEQLYKTIDEFENNNGFEILNKFKNRIKIHYYKELIIKLRIVQYTNENNTKNALKYLFLVNNREYVSLRKDIKNLLKI